MDIWKCTHSSFGSLSPAFCYNKSRKKAFGFRVNRVYLTEAFARKQTNWLFTTRFFLNPTGANIAILHRNKADGGTTVPMKNWLSFSNYNAWIGEKSCIFKLDFSWIKNVHQFVKANDILLCSYLFR